MSLNIAEDHYIYNKQKSDLSVQDFREKIFVKLQQRGIVIDGYEYPKKKLGIDRSRYHCIIESITGYSILERLDRDVICKVYKSLLEFREKYEYEDKEKSVFDIRKYISYYSKSPEEKYYLSWEEFTHLINFFRLFLDPKIPLETAVFDERF